MNNGFKGRFTIILVMTLIFSIMNVNIWAKTPVVVQRLEPQIETINNNVITIDDTTCLGECMGHVIETTSSAIKISGSKVHQVTLKNVSINRTNNENQNAFKLENGSKANLIVEGKNIFKGGKYSSGLQIGNDATLNIQSQSTGSLEVIEGDYNLDIGLFNTKPDAVILEKSSALNLQKPGLLRLNQGSTIVIKEGATLNIKEDEIPSYISQIVTEKTGKVIVGGKVIVEGKILLQPQDVNIASKEFNYTGSPITPLPIVTCYGKTLIKDNDYTVSYKNNEKVGTAEVTIQGKGKYTGSITETFSIKKTDTILTLNVDRNSKTYAYGEPIIITASVNSQKDKNLSLRTANADEVVFYINKIAEENKLGTGFVKSGTTTLVYETKLGKIATLDNQKIIAVYGGNEGLNEVTQTLEGLNLVKQTCKAETIKKEYNYNKYYKNEKIDISAKLPSDRGETTYTLGRVDGDRVVDRTPSIDSKTGVLYFNIEEGYPRSKATILVDVTMQNYKDITINVQINLKDKKGSSSHHHNNDDDDDYEGNIRILSKQKGEPTVASLEGIRIIDRSDYTYKLTKEQVRAAAKKAEENAKRYDKEDGIALQVKTDKEDEFNLKFSQETLRELTYQRLEYLSIVSDAFEMKFDLSSLRAIEEDTKDDITIGIKKVTRLSGIDKEQIKDRPVYKINVDYDVVKKGEREVHALSAVDHGKITVSLFYKLRTSEKAENICGLSIENDKVYPFEEAEYDKNQKMLTFKTRYFLTYAVGYKKEEPQKPIEPIIEIPYFYDTTSHWAKADIEFVCSRGILVGTAENQFSPNATMTRGMFVTALGRMAQIDITKYSSNRFQDVKENAYYRPYIEWAATHGIVSGVGNGKFAPSAPITREQMAVIMANYVKWTDKTLPIYYSAGYFRDNYEISIWAKSSVKAMQEAAILFGKNGNYFEPKGMATRAEVSALIHRLVENVYQ